MVAKAECHREAHLIQDALEHVVAIQGPLEQSAQVLQGLRSDHLQVVPLHCVVAACPTAVCLDCVGTLAHARRQRERPPAQVQFCPPIKEAQPTWRALGVLWLTWLYRRPSCTMSPAYTASWGGGVTLASFWVVIWRQGVADVVGGSGAAGFAPNAGLLLPANICLGGLLSTLCRLPFLEYHGGLL